MFVRSYYDILGVPVTASPREIREAFRRLARQYSPDIAVGDRQAAPIFVEIEEAYFVLSDPTRRALYDQHSRKGPSRTESTGFAPARSPQGTDLYRTVELAFEEAVRGSVVRLPIVRKTRCEACGGRGASPEAVVTCPACAGSGRKESVPGASGEVCARCFGTGEAVGQPCSRCLGEGLTASQEEVGVNIPPGVDTGSQLRIRGKGNDGARGGPAGDLVVLTRVQPHPLFTRKGDNLYCELPITLPEAILGARISVPTPDGTTVMTIPAGTQSGQVFRLRGKGCPHLTGTGRGDLYVATRVVIPRALDPSRKDAIAWLGSLYPEHPRSRLETHAVEREGRHGG